MLQRKLGVVVMGQSMIGRKINIHIMRTEAHIVIDQTIFDNMPIFDLEIEKFKDIENFVYLMVDNTNGLIKIGRSKNPKLREGTLQSKEPETKKIAQWRVPKSIEKDLHSKFSHKRIRGEWFRLTIEDMVEIKLYMNSL